MLLFDVTKDFETCCDHILKEKRTERAFIRNHERKVIVLQNLCNQVQVYEKRFRTRLDIRERNKIVAASAQLFVEAALKEHDQKQWSEAKRIGEERKVWEKEELQDELSKGIVEADGTT